MKPSGETREILLKDVVLPEDAREHSPEDLDILAQDMQRNGQLQEIIVASDDGQPPYTVVSGVGRTLAARRLDWKEIRASVREGLSDFDRLQITFSENDAQEDVSPIYQAYLLEQMLVEGNLKNQAELARKLGKSEAHITQYLSLRELPEQVRKVLNRFKTLGIAHLIQICRLSKANDQIRLGEMAAKEAWSVRELGKAVNDLLNTEAKSSTSVFDLLNRPASKPKDFDPFEPFWKGLKESPEFGPFNWHAEYRDRTWVFSFKRPELNKDGTSDLALFRWLKTLSKSTSIMLPAEEGDHNKESEDLLSSESTIPPKRMPKNAAEEAELLALVPKGPYPVYAWLYGENSPEAHALKNMTWKDLEIKDPLEGTRELLKELRKLQ